MYAKMTDPNTISRSFRLFQEELVNKSNECRSKYFPQSQQFRGSETHSITSIRFDNDPCAFTGASCNKTDDDNVSIMAPHQSYFDEYPSGTGKIIKNVVCGFRSRIYLSEYVRSSACVRIPSNTRG